MTTKETAAEAVVAYATKMRWERRHVDMNRKCIAMMLKLIRAGRRERLIKCRGFRCLKSMTGEFVVDAYGLPTAKRWTVLWNEAA